ncbi:hypothetical protein [Acinetobacter sp.]|uniref:hypothetical protein n=1 Tax=Acinetobacter sp. TaxID=472 RepID=UPI00388D9107
MILQLAENHGYSKLGLHLFGDWIGKDLTFEQFAALGNIVEMWIMHKEDAEPNTIYVAHPGAY